MIRAVFIIVILISMTSFGVESKVKVDGRLEALLQIMSVNPQVRRSAILLLGKFEDSKSMSAIIDSLGDQDALVRHSAMTAVNEYLMVAPDEIIIELKRANQKSKNGTISDVYRMIVDPEIDNRRLASKLAVAIGSYLGFRPEFLPEVVQKQILKSYADEDSIVRFNMFRNYPTLRKITPDSILLTGIQDTDPQVQKEALEKLVYYNRDLATKHLATLLKTRDESSRVFVMKSVCYGPANEAVVSIYENLVNDPNPVVAAYAIYGLIRVKQYPTEKQLDYVLGTIGISQQGLGRNIINSVARLPHYKNWLFKKYKDKSYPFYKTILLIYIQQNQEEFSVEELLHWFNQPNENISRSVSYVLGRKKLKLAQLLPLVDSEYVHTRRGLITLAYRLEKVARDELLSLLILDDDLDVQVEALKMCGRLRSKDYLVYAEGTLTEIHQQKLLAVGIQIFLSNKTELIRRIKTDLAFRRVFIEAIQACSRVIIPTDIKNLLKEEGK